MEFSFAIDNFIVNNGIFLLVLIFSFLVYLVKIGFYKRHFTSKNIKEKCKESFPAMEKFKQDKKEIYIHSIKVAQLAVAAAKTVDANTDFIMAASLYHDIGKDDNDNYLRASLKIAQKYKLPYQVQKIISEHNPKLKKPTTIESAIVMLADSVMTTIDYRSESKDLTTEEIILIVRNVFNLRLEQGVFSELEISVNEFEEIRKSFIEFFKEVE